MGIYEAFLRVKQGFGLTMAEVKSLSVEDLAEKLIHIRNYYYRPRIGEIFGDVGDSQYLKDILDNVVLRNAAAVMKRNSELVEIVSGDVRTFLNKYDNVIFETGQGLLLDAENKKYAPNVTGSRTGLTNPGAFLDGLGLAIDEVVYVTRSYVTRHGAGELSFVCERQELGDVEADSTNVTNIWQGSFRYAPHASVYDFIDPVISDLKQLSYRPKVTLVVTHLSETGGKVVFQDRESDMTVKELGMIKEVSMVFDGFWELS